MKDKAKVCCIRILYSNDWKWLRKFSFYFLLLIASVKCSSAQSATEPQPRYPNPVPAAPTVRVFLFSFERGELLQVTDAPNTDVILTKAPGYFQAYMFQCNASFPIQWSYVGDGAPIMTADVGRQFTDFYDASTYTYHAAMIMFNLREQNSGRYICRGIEAENQKISSYFHLYVPGPNILVSTVEKAVQVAPYKEQITLPCSASDPTATVNLYKGNHKGVYKRIETNSSITYSPRKGFRIHRNLLQDPMGKYLCIAESSKRRVRITVLPKDEAGYVQRTKRQAYANDLYVTEEPIEFSYDSQHHRMLCCSRGGIAPKLTFAGCTSIVDCEIKSACFREGQCEPRENTGDAMGYYNKYIGLDPPGCTGHSLRSDPNGDNGLFLCQDTTSPAMLYQPFQLNRGNLFMSFQEAPPPDKVMTLDRATSEELFVGSETQFRCNCSRFFFGFGVRFAFERFNGDLDFIPDDDVVNDLYFVNNHRRHTTLRIPDANIKSIVCAAPVWNSPTEWRMLSLPITVAAAPPQTTPSPIARQSRVQRPKYSPPELPTPQALYVPEHALQSTFQHRFSPLQTTLPSFEEDPSVLSDGQYAAFIPAGTQPIRTDYPAATQQSRFIGYSTNIVSSNDLPGHGSNQYYYTSRSVPRVRRKIEKTANSRK